MNGGGNEAAIDEMSLVLQYLLGRELLLTDGGNGDIGSKPIRFSSFISTVCFTTIFFSLLTCPSPSASGVDSLVTSVLLANGRVGEGVDDLVDVLQLWLLSATT
jgi:hypothetical protein